MSNHRAEAVAYLESIQKPYYVPVDDAALGEIFDEVAVETEAKGGPLFDLRQEHAMIMKDMYSRYEYPPLFIIMNGIVKSIEPAIPEVLKSSAIKDNKKVLFGSVLTGDVNGCAVNFKNEEYHIILIDSGLFGFANLLTKALAGAFPLFSDDEKRSQSDIVTLAKKHISSNQTARKLVADRLVDLVFSYVVKGDTHKAKQYFIENSYVNLSGPWCMAMETFIFGHEFGHVRLGHLDELIRNAVDRGEAIPRQGFSELPIRWKQEFEADYFGMRIALHCLGKKGMSPVLVYAGIESFFVGLELIERTLAKFFGVSYENNGSLTHPPAPRRRQSLKRGLGSYLSATDFEASISLASLLEEISQIILPSIDSVAERLIETGVKPHPKWHL